MNQENNFENLNSGPTEREQKIFEEVNEELERAGRIPRPRTEEERSSAMKRVERRTKEGGFWDKMLDFSENYKIDGRRTAAASALTILALNLFLSIPRVFKGADPEDYDINSQGRTDNAITREAPPEDVATTMMQNLGQEDVEIEVERVKEVERSEKITGLAKWARKFAEDPQAGEMVRELFSDDIINKIQEIQENKGEVERIIIIGHSSAEDDSLSSEGLRDGGLQRASEKNIELSEERASLFSAVLKAELEEKDLSDIEIYVEDSGIEDFLTEKEVNEVKELAEKFDYSATETSTPVAAMIEQYNREPESVPQEVKDALDKILAQERYVEVIIDYTEQQKETATVVVPKLVEEEQEEGVSSVTPQRPVIDTENEAPQEEERDPSYIPAPFPIIIPIWKRKEEEEIEKIKESRVKRSYKVWPDKGE